MNLETPILGDRKIFDPILPIFEISGYQSSVLPFEPNDLQIPTIIIHIKSVEMLGPDNKMSEDKTKRCCQALPRQRRTIPQGESQKAWRLIIQLPVKTQPEFREHIYEHPHPIFLIVHLPATNC